MSQGGNLSSSYDSTGTSVMSKNDNDDPVSTGRSKSKTLYSFLGFLQNISIGLLTISLSIAILAYAAISWRANGNLVESKEHRLLDIAKYLTTAFPFIFAFVLSRSLTDIFNLQLERGIGLAQAAYLSRSVSLGSVIGSIFSYRTLHWLPLAILLLYSLSPLGSQATLRFVSIAPTSAPSVRVQYIYPDATNKLENGDPGVSENVAQALLLSAMVSSSSTGSKPQDTWGNIKIPFYESLDKSTKDSQGFTQVPKNNVEYTSLIGIPISLPPGNFNSTFSIQSWYWRFQDSNLTSPLPNLKPTNDFGALLSNLTDNSVWTPSSMTIPQPFQFAVKAADTNASTIPFPLWFQDYNPAETVDDHAVTNLTTTVTQTFVESQVSCQLTSCAVVAMREVAPLTNKTESNVQGLTIWGISNFGGAIPSAHPGTIDSQGILEAYLGAQQSSNPFSIQSLGAINLYTVGADNLAQRLNILINTYWIGSTALSTAAGAFDSSFKNLASLDLNDKLINTTASVFVDSFHCDKAWLSVLILASSVMILLAMASIAVNLTRSGTQDFTDFAWVLTHSTFISSNLQSHHDASATLKALPNAKVRVGDARPNEPHGRIVIAEQGEMLGRLTRERHFV